MSINLIYGDGIEALKRMKDNQFEWAIVDPNYGRKQHGGTNRQKLVTQQND